MKHLLYILISVLLLSSCNKDMSEEFYSYQNNPLNDTAWKSTLTTNSPVNTITDILSSYERVYVDSFTVGTGGTINFDEGVKLIFPPNACISATGTAVTGKVKVVLVYLNRRGDYIKFAKSQISNDMILQGAGSFRINLFQNGNEIFLQPTSSYKLTFKTNYPNNPPVNGGVKLFYETYTSGNGDTTRNWTLTDTQLSSYNFGIITPVQILDTLSGVFSPGYECQTRKLNWLNCGAFDSIVHPQRVNVSLPLNFTNNNTQAYVVFKSKNIVLKLKADLLTRTFYFPKISGNTEVSIVTISKINDDYYLGSKNLVIQNSNLISISPQEKSIQSILNYLDSL